MDPSGSRVAVRVAKPDDIDALERIEAASFDGDRLSRRSLGHHLQSQTCDVFVATLGGAVSAYAMMFYRRTSSIGRLYSIASLPEARGHGLAARLVAACEKAAAARGCSALRLEVREDNAAAIRLYQKLGYSAFGRYEGYYEDGAPALRFEKPLTGRLGGRSGARAA
jgi:ribosomal-protein-alanine N-acetyltransferase